MILAHGILVVYVDTGKKEETIRGTYRKFQTSEAIGQDEILGIRKREIVRTRERRGFCCIYVLPDKTVQYISHLELT